MMMLRMWLLCVALLAGAVCAGTTGQQGTTDGSNIVNLSDSALSSNVPLKNAANTFTAAQTIGTQTLATNGLISNTAPAAPTAHATLTNHTTDATYCTLKTTAAHGIVAGQGITLAGWTWTTGAINASFHIYDAPTTTTLRIALTGQTGNPTVAGTITPYAQVRFGAAPTTPDADADVVIGATGTGQVPLVVQGAASAADNLTEWQASTGVAGAAVGKTGTIIGTNGVRIGTVEYFAQAAAPATRADGSALVTGDVWTETDNGGMVWVYDSTVDSGTWLSQQIHPFAYHGNSAAGSTRWTTRVGLAAYDLYVVSIGGSCLVDNGAAKGQTISLERVTQQNGAPVTVTSFKTWAAAAAGNKRAVTANVATITIAAGHDFIVGERITVANCGDATYDGTYAITAVTATTLSFTLTHGDEAETVDAAVVVYDESGKWSHHYKTVGTLLDVSSLDIKSLSVLVDATGGAYFYGEARVEIRLAVPK